MIKYQAKRGILMYYQQLRIFILSFMVSIVFASVGYSKDISMNFLANASLRITDGDYILFTDFPYVSGAFGHMIYTYPYFVEQDNNVTTLITNRREDHFDPDVFMTLKGWKIIAPPEVTGDLKKRYKGLNDARNVVVARLKSDHKVNMAISWDSETKPVLVLPEPINKLKILPFAEKMTNGPMEITAYKTKSAQTEHYSYLVEWGGRKIYLAGDTGDTDHLAALPELDIAFLSPWLYENARRDNVLPHAKKIVIYQHKENEIIPNCRGCIIPQQGEYIPFD